MARNRKRTKKERNFLLPVKGLVLGVFILFVIFFASRQAVSFLRTAKMFNVSEVLLPSTLQFIDQEILDNVKGRNIFQIDLALFRTRLESLYPQLDQVRVWRQFPERLIVSARVRMPYALINVGQQRFTIDQGGVVLSIGQDIREDLPLISGVILAQEALVGKPVRNKNLQAALDILVAVRENAKSVTDQIGGIDVNNLSRIILTRKDGPQIIMDLEDIRGEALKMGIVLAQKDIDLQKVGYLDLRFKEPVMGQK